MHLFEAVAEAVEATLADLPQATAQAAPVVDLPATVEAVAVEVATDTGHIQGAGEEVLEDIPVPAAMAAEAAPTHQARHLLLLVALDQAVAVVAVVAANGTLADMC